MIDPVKIQDKRLWQSADSVPLEGLVGMGLQDSNGLYMGVVIQASERLKTLETDRNYHIPLDKLDYFKIVPKMGENPNGR